MTTKKPAAKKTAAKKASGKPLELTRPTERYSMPVEVSEWIERAHSTIQHLRGEVERLKSEVKNLKAYKTWAEHRILRAEAE